MMKRLFFLGIMAGLGTSCSLTVPVAATSNPVGQKVGKSTATCYFNICINGDASILTAAENGGITKISTVDYRKKNILGVVQKHVCIVTGE